MKRYMQLALDLAKQGQGKTSPNPMVGAVIVKNSHIIGKGYHKKFGGPHAEINALKQAGARAKDATMYVTLEPCRFFGKTPPCTDAIIKSGIKKVVAATRDPNPKSRGRGIAILRRNKIKVDVGLMKKEAQALNEPFNKFITTGMPHVTLKMAQSLDGKIAARTGESKWISCGESRRLVYKLRRQVDAVIVGANTARIDKPRMKQARKKIVVGSAKKDKVNLKQFLKGLANKGITSILCEGGGEIAWSLLAEGLVDKLLIFISPKIIGGRDAKTSVEGSGIARMKDAIRLKNIEITTIGKDVLIECLPA